MTAKRIVTGAMIAVMAGIAFMLFGVVQSSATRERREGVLAFNGNSRKPLAELRECLLEKPLGGLALVEQRSGWSTDPDMLVNAARHMTVQIADNGAVRSVRVVVRKDYRLRDGEAAQLGSCLRD